MTTCKWCGKQIEFIPVFLPPRTRGWEVMEKHADGHLVPHDCQGQEKRTSAYTEATRQAKAEGFHGAALDVEVKRRVYGKGGP